MSPRLDITGWRFERLVAVALAPRRPQNRMSFWRCVCDCGRETEVALNKLRGGHTKSCGCLQHERDPNCAKRRPEYAIWWGIVVRCENPRRRTWANYGGAGISICPEWRRSFWAFFDHIGPRPSPKHSVDRIDSKGNYEPGNVRWATPVEQTNNRCNTRFVEYHGERLPLTEAVRRAGSLIHPQAAWRRITASGWAVERAVETPPSYPAWNSRARAERAA